jgi:integrase
MARSIHKLSAVRIQKLTKPGYYGDGGNLYFRVTDRGTKSWIFRFAVRAASSDARRPPTRDMGLGPYPDVGLSQARELAALYREQLRRGVDPIDARRIERTNKQRALALASAKTMTFEQCAEAYIAEHSRGWSNVKHQQQWKTTLKTYAYPVFGSVAVQDVDTALVISAIQPLWSSKAETASRLRGRIERVLDWAAVSGHRSGENPARWRGHLAMKLPAKNKVQKVKHHPALPYEKLGSFMIDLRAQEGMAARALELLILTVTRTSEALGAQWKEFDLRARVWTVPAERMKARKEHRVPLSDAAIAVLETMQEVRQGDFVFAGSRSGRPLSDRALLMLLRRMGYDAVTSHGFRSTFRDWAADTTNYPNHVVEMALAHTIRNPVEAAYRRGDLFEKRRKLMDSWAAFCAKALAGVAGKVIAISQRLS